MASLSDLPTELLSYILQYNTEEDCLPLLTVDRRFYGVARQQLYRNITLEWKTNAIPPVEKLLRSVLENQDLRHLVKSLELHGGTSHSRCQYDVPPVVPLTLDRNKASSTIRETHFPHTEAWEAAFMEGSLDALVSLLVVLLPDLGRLSVLDNFARDNHILSQTALHAAHTTPSTRDSDQGPFGEGFWPPLSKLSDVTIFRRRSLQTDRKIKRNTPEVLGWFYLPSIQRLRLSIDNPLEFSWPSALPPPRPRYLRHLALDQIRESRALPILSACPEVKELSWNLRHEYGFDIDVISARPCFDLQQVSAALTTLQSLEILNLSAECFRGPYEMDDPPMNLLGSLDLANLSCLKNLAVPWHIVLGMEPRRDRTKSDILGTLPTGLNSLILNDDLAMVTEVDWEDADYSAISRGFLEETRFRYTPHLRQFGVHLGPDDASFLKVLEDICKKAGLASSIINTTLESYPLLHPQPWCWLWAPPACPASEDSLLQK